MDINLTKIGKKWQDIWGMKKAFEIDWKSNNPKFYALEMFSYPSGKLHMGHVRNYSLGDVVARFKRLNGFNVVYPVGFDALGLPAENAAITHGTHPKIWTEKCIQGMIDQLKIMGFSYDWNTLMPTCYPEYYKWNQWFFIQMFNKGLAYRKSGLINWCDKCNTVLANEQVIDGKCWRCSMDVVQKPLEQWYYKIKEYQEELLADIDKLEEWPEKVKVMQKNWIGKSHGTVIKFKVDGLDKEIETFTTRVDTIYGITYLVFAPESEMVMELAKGTEQEQVVINFIKEASKVTPLERQMESREKKGVFLGRYAINPINNEKFPLWVGDYVIADYGTGAVMAVPSHDQRDFEFAKKYNLPMKLVITDEKKEILNQELSEAYISDGEMVNSGQFDGMNNRDAIPKIQDYLEKNNFGHKEITFRLRDWLISRQRFWGTPIPIIYCDDCGIQTVPEEQLPVELPDDVLFDGKGNPLLTSSSFMNVKCPKCGKDARRETDTMDTFVDSSWYFFRYLDKNNQNKIFSKEKADKFMPVDYYVGGIEHAILHLLYSRFYTKVLRDMGLTNISEPFKKLLTLGMVLKDGAKMSKSLGNTVDPHEILEKYGADTARTFILFASQPEKEMDWSDKGVEGVFKFLNKFANLIEKPIKFNDDESYGDMLLKSKLNFTIINATKYYEDYRFNFSISEIMNLTNDFIEISKMGITENTYDYVLDKLLIIFNPVAPHLTEEINELRLNKKCVYEMQWPSASKDSIKLGLHELHCKISTIRSDVKAIMKMIKAEKINGLELFVSEDWKYKLYNIIKEHIDKRDNKIIITDAMKDEDIKKSSPEAIKIISRVMKDTSLIPKEIFTKQQEIDNLNFFSKQLENEFGCTVTIHDANTSLDDKARQALPGKVAIKLL